MKGKHASKRKRKIIKGTKLQEALAPIDVVALPPLPEPVPELIEAIKEGYVEEIVIAEPESDAPKPSWWDKLIHFFAVNEG